MKNITLLLNMLLCLIVFSSCSNEDKDILSNTPKEIRIVVPSFELDKVETRTHILLPDYWGKTSEFRWNANDTIGIIPNFGSQVYFTLNSGSGTDKASFDGGPWDLKTDQREPKVEYAAYYPFVKDYTLVRTNIPVNYTGQCFEPCVDYTLTSISNYDNIASIPATATSERYIPFNFKHINSLVEFRFSMPTGTKIKKIDISTNDNAKVFALKGTYDITTMNTDPDNLKSAVDINVKEEDKTNIFTVETKNVTAINDSISVFCMMAPTNISGKKFVVKVTKEDNTTTSFECANGGKDMKPGTWYICLDDAQYNHYFKLQNYFSNLNK